MATHPSPFITARASPARRRSVGSIICLDRPVYDLTKHGASISLADVRTPLHGREDAFLDSDERSLGRLRRAPACRRQRYAARRARLACRKRLSRRQRAMRARMLRPRADGASDIPGAVSEPSGFWPDESSSESAGRIATPPGRTVRRPDWRGTGNRRRGDVCIARGRVRGSLQSFASPAFAGFAVIAAPQWRSGAADEPSSSYVYRSTHQ